MPLITGRLLLIPEVNSYSEGGVLLLQFWSMYLALALKQFVANVTGDMRTQWSWKCCLMYTIRAMNDVGIEFYFSFETYGRYGTETASTAVIGDAESVGTHVYHFLLSYTLLLLLHCSFRSVKVRVSRHVRLSTVYQAQ
jgi:hypothetical protein